MVGKMDHVAFWSKPKCRHLHFGKSAARCDWGASAAVRAPWERFSAGPKASRFRDPKLQPSDAMPLLDLA